MYAAGVTHRGPYKDGPGEINVPIAIDGMVIQPGDLIVGDADGLLCVPYDDVETVLPPSPPRWRAEAKTLAAIAEGRHDTSWIDAAPEAHRLRTRSRAEPMSPKQPATISASSQHMIPRSMRVVRSDLWIDPAFDQQFP